MQSAKMEVLGNPVNIGENWMWGRMALTLEREDMGAGLIV